MFFASFPGVPDVCSPFCSGNSSEADRLHHKHFRCERYMPDIANCFMESYQVLPSEPRNIFFSNVGGSLGKMKEGGRKQSNICRA